MQALRIGFGYDVHAFAPACELWLGAFVFLLNGDCWVIQMRMY